MMAADQDIVDGVPAAEVPRVVGPARLLNRYRMLCGCLGGALIAGVVFVGTLFLAHRAVLQGSWLAEQHENLLLTELIVLAVLTLLAGAAGLVRANREVPVVRQVIAFFLGALLAAALVFAAALKAGLIFDDWFAAPEPQPWWKFWASDTAAEDTRPVPSDVTEEASWWEVWK